VQVEAFFLPVTDAKAGGTGQRFCLFYPAQKDRVASRARALVLYIHPFAEEMNKSRRMAALQARALAQSGFAVLQIDLTGCGDSSGDFGDATWQGWVNDVVAGCHWLRQRCPAPVAPDASPPPLWLWGLRAGCLVAVDAAMQLDEPCNFLFWQPPASGKPVLQQFLRLKVAGDMLSGQSKGVMEALRQQLASGSSVEIAGYMLAPELASGLEQANLARPPPGTDRQQVLWLELSNREAATLSPMALKSTDQWEQAHYRVHSSVVQGPAFWQTTEIEEAPALLEATTTALSKLAS
jgi:exosortase A-associated hydrolase 2